MVSRQKISNTMVEHATGIHTFSNKKVKETLGYTFIPVADSIVATAKFYTDARGNENKNRTA